jgi:hypothetical protein
MSCTSCGSENQMQFVTEINLHLTGTKTLSQPAVLVFPKVWVCLDCGLSQFTLPESEVVLLKGGHSGSGRRGAQSSVDFRERRRA